MSDITQINSEIDNNSTVINSEIFDSSSTVINSEIIDMGDIPYGTILLGKYSIIAPPTNS